MGLSDSMREIKFRAWDKNTKVMHYTNPIASRNRSMTWTGLVYDNGELLDYVMMQYTGLKDKNGVEIYEGDILREQCKNYDQECCCGKCEHQYYYMYTEVKFNPLKGFYIEVGHYLKEEDFTKREVIGNKYENPKLLKE